MSATTEEDAPQEGLAISSILDTDLYKLTMQCAVLDHYPDIDVVYSFTNRTPEMQLTKEAFTWLDMQVKGLADVHLTEEEADWLDENCPYLSGEYLTYLEKFRFKPKDNIKLDLNPPANSLDDKMTGTLSVEIRGQWLDTILYEIPLLALISEAYFKFVDKDLSYDGQIEKAMQKGLQLIEHGCSFSEFGSRRRRSYHTHDLVVQGLLAAQAEADTNGKGWTGKLAGTSNVDMARRWGLTPIGTVAHEWFMAVAVIEKEGYKQANYNAMRAWCSTFDNGVLAIALTDTFGTPSFLKAFAAPTPVIEDVATNGNKPHHEYVTFAEAFAGVRQDSGDPLEFIAMMRDWYTSRGMCMDGKPPKTIVFSDSLNVEKCFKYHDATVNVGLIPSFGIGTFLTNDFERQSKPGEKSVPLNIVIKLSEAYGKPTVKLSDNKGKNTGDDELIKEVKRLVEYEERDWAGGDEQHRWDQ